jgi:hypothetical protein
MEQVMELTMECLQAIMDDIKASQERTISKTHAHQKRMEANMNAWRNKMKAHREATEAYTETAEARIETDQEPTEAEIKTGLVKVEAMAEQQEVPNEDAAVETIRALNDHSGDRRLATRHACSVFIESTMFFTT